MNSESLKTDGDEIRFSRNSTDRYVLDPDISRDRPLDSFGEPCDFGAALPKYSAKMLFEIARAAPTSVVNEEVALLFSIRGSKTPSTKRL